ncbi:MAG: thioesterase family protein [Burkholderiaceae bacterium]
MIRTIRIGRQAYRHFHPMTTRWMDNDAYGHINNVVYYSWFDTVVNEFLIRSGELDIEHSSVIGLVVETRCVYFSSVAFPDRVTAGLRVSKLGNSSAHYEIGIFRGDDAIPAAQGSFVHVYVARASRKPTPLPESLRTLLHSIRAETT